MLRRGLGEGYERSRRGLGEAQGEGLRRGLVEG